MRARTTRTALFTATAIGLLTAATVQPASAQGDPVPGQGNVYYFAGAWNTDGQAQAVVTFGDRDDEVYFGDWYGQGVDLPLVRRGNSFYVPSDSDPSITADVFSYGDAGDTVLVGDWNGDGVDSLAVHRGHRFFVKDDNTTTGKADTEFSYGDAGDTVLVGNWDGRVEPPSAEGPGKGDTLVVRRGNRYYVKNDLDTGVAEYYRDYGTADDVVLAANWTNGGLRAHGMFLAGPADSDLADQLVVRRGGHFIISEELRLNYWELYLQSAWQFDYGDPGDAVFVAALPTELGEGDGVEYSEDGSADQVIEADGLGVRRTN
jgi:hypothetical protein